MHTHPHAHGGEPFERSVSVNRTSMLVDAATDLLDEAGLEGLTIRSVLLRSGLARRAYYEQFSTKDDLILAVLKRRLTFAAEHFRNQADGQQDPVEALRCIIVGLVLGHFGVGGTGTGKRSVALSREHLRLAESRPQDLQAALKPILALITEHIAIGAALGKLRSCDPRLQAGLVYNFVAATVQVELATENGNAPDRCGRTELATANLGVLPPRHYGLRAVLYKRMQDASQ